MRSNASSYAVPFNSGIKAMMIATEFSIEAIREAANQNRYFGLNFQPSIRNRRSNQVEVNNDGTVEFRLFNCTMNADRLEAMVHSAVGMVLAAERGILANPSRLTRYNCYPLGGVADGYRSEQAVRLAAQRMYAKVLPQRARRLIGKYWNSAVPQTCFVGAGYHLPGWTGQAAVPPGRQVSEPSPLSQSESRSMTNNSPWATVISG